MKNNIYVELHRFDDGMMRCYKDMCPKAALINTITKFELRNSKVDMRLFYSVHDDMFAQTVEISEPSMLVIDNEPFIALEKAGIYAIRVRFPEKGAHSMDVELI